jgi:hypothetical protein
VEERGTETGMSIDIDKNEAIGMTFWVRREWELKDPRDSDPRDGEEGSESS